MSATPQDYTVVANAVLKVINGELDADVPGWAKGFIPAGIAVKLANACAKTAVDTLDAHRKVIATP